MAFSIITRWIDRNHDGRMNPGEMIGKGYVGPHGEHSYHRVGEGYGRGHEYGHRGHEYGRGYEYGRGHEYGRRDHRFGNPFGHQVGHQFGHQFGPIPGHFAGGPRHIPGAGPSIFGHGFCR